MSGPPPTMIDRAIKSITQSNQSDDITHPMSYPQFMNASSVSAHAKAEILDVGYELRKANADLNNTSFSTQEGTWTSTLCGDAGGSANVCVIVAYADGDEKFWPPNWGENSGPGWTREKFFRVTGGKAPSGYEEIRQSYRRVTTKIGKAVVAARTRPQSVQLITTKPSSKRHRSTVKPPQELYCLPPGFAVFEKYDPSTKKYEIFIFGSRGGAYTPIDSFIPHAMWIDAGMPAECPCECEKCARARERRVDAPRLTAPEGEHKVGKKAKERGEDSVKPEWQPGVTESPNSGRGKRDVSNGVIMPVCVMIVFRSSTELTEHAFASSNQISRASTHKPIC